MELESIGLDYQRQMGVCEVHSSKKHSALIDVHLALGRHEAGSYEGVKGLVLKPTLAPDIRDGNSRHGPTEGSRTRSSSCCHVEFCIQLRRRHKLIAQGIEDDPLQTTRRDE